MRAWAAALALATAVFGPAAAGAACTVPAPPVKTVTVEAGAASDSVTRGQAWSERSLSVVSRDGNRFSAYGRLASDSRFGATDPSYEAGVYTALGAHVIANVGGAFSPTHTFLPATAETAALDWRTGNGYGVQGQFAQRNYPAQIARIATIGADRYAGTDRFQAGITFARLTTVPGTALTAHAGFARYLSCDDETFSVAAGRDVESTGIAGRVAVYTTYAYDANDVHWFSRRFGLNVGAGWTLLVGAYDRFEVRAALRERF